MALITPEFVKDNFEEWDIYCTVEGSSKTPDQILQIKIDRAEDEFLEYLNVDETTITAQQKRHLLNIVKKNCFDIRHGSTEFDQKPQIIKDYEATIKALEEYRLAKRGIDGSASIKMNAKDREFDEWFTDPVTDADSDPNN